LEDQEELSDTEVIKRLTETFEVLPKRWVIERTLAGSIAIAV
jgi:hypothetical protein